MTPPRTRARRRAGRAGVASSSSRPARFTRIPPLPESVFASSPAISVCPSQSVSAMSPLWRTASKKPSKYPVSHTFAGRTWPSFAPASQALHVTSRGIEFTLPVRARAALVRQEAHRGEGHAAGIALVRVRSLRELQQWRQRALDGRVVRLRVAELALPPDGGGELKAVDGRLARAHALDEARGDVHGL